MNTTANKKEAGFTLIELAIVLVIIGLIVGGVLTGKSLIKAAEVRSALTQITKINTAVNVFRDKFGGMPGDLSNPAAVGMAVPSGTPNLGNNAIEDGSGTAGKLFDGEVTAFMVDLSKAQMMSDITNATIQQFAAVAQTANVSMPVSPFGNGFFVWVSSGKGVTGTNYSPVGFENANNYFHLTTVTGVAAAGTVTDTKGMTPLDAAALDSKLDDGVPNTGLVLANNGGTAVGTAASGGDMQIDAADGCVLATNVAIYDASANPNQLACSLAIQTGF